MDLQLTNSQLIILLDKKFSLYNTHAFIETDPIQIPHAFSKKEDIEIAGFFAATLAWGQRTTIIKNSKKLMQLMDNAPYDFILNANSSDLKSFDNFVHRTFQAVDCVYFIRALQHIYKKHKGLENVFTYGYFQDKTIFNALLEFRKTFFQLPHLQRTEKHVANVYANASAKRLNMFLRWMIRNDDGGVDFGLWKGIPASALMLPLDVHTGNVARNLGLLVREQNDWKAVEEVTVNLRKFDATDPVKYDFALFGIGAFEKQ